MPVIEHVFRLPVALEIDADRKMYGVLCIAIQWYFEAKACYQCIVMDDVGCVNYDA